MATKKTKTPAKTPTRTTTQAEARPAAKPLTASQIKHAAERLREAAKKKRDAIEVPDKYVSEQDHRQLQREAIARGEARYKGPCGGFDASDDASLYNLFEYTRLPSLSDERERAKTEHDAAVWRRSAIMTEAERLIDQLILGDASAALEMIKAFTEKEF